MPHVNVWSIVWCWLRGSTRGATCKPPSIMHCPVHDGEIKFEKESGSAPAGRQSGQG